MSLFALGANVSILKSKLCIENCVNLFHKKLKLLFLNKYLIFVESLTCAM